ncbi:MAG: DNA repair protein RecN [Beijerinckiaceae bacterium]|jgi:DNA repair protein RecN (Recombination protein N)|nr:DNA repair protein RecN [Beijerinckiaceae bacterium]
MLSRISIRDIVLIEKLDLAFQQGLSVLTGETGAGKSILLDSLALALGGRGDGSLVRAGAAQGQVTAVFDLLPGHAAIVAAVEAGAEVEGDLILRRVQMADGRSRAYVNDQPVSMQALRAIGATLVEIHGQHADRAMIDPGTHRDLVDDFAGLAEDVAELAQLHAQWREAGRALREHEARIEAARREADYIRHATAELDKLAPEPGEEERLAAERQRMMQAEKITGDLREAADILSGDHAPGPTLLSVLRRLERRREQAGPDLAEAVTALDAALQSLDLAHQSLDAELRRSEFDPRELERIEERLFALRAAGRKYQTPVDDLPALAAKLAGDLEALDHGEAELVRLQKEVAAREAVLASKARMVSEKRQNAARALDEAIAAELPPLKLERARFETRVETDPARLEASGIDRVEFHVATNPGSRPGPMMKVASGGELARFMLALKVTLADRGSAPTLVFDEIDTGVGGAVADAIGARLARLAARVQVLAVTHAPQVAARASTHFEISKAASGEGDRVATRVRSLDDGARREEIARMLSGAAITDEARAAAARLLET